MKKNIFLLLGLASIFLLAQACSENFEEKEMNIPEEISVENRDACATPTLYALDYPGNDAWSYINDIVSTTEFYLACAYPEVIEAGCEEQITLTVDFLDLCSRYNVGSCTDENGNIFWNEINIPEFDAENYVEDIISSINLSEVTCGQFCTATVTNVEYVPGEPPLCCSCGLGSDYDIPELPCEDLHLNSAVSFDYFSKLEVTYSCCCKTPTPGPGSNGNPAQ